MTVAISNSWIKDLSWARSYAVRKDLVEAYGNANTLLQDPNVPIDVLKQAFRHYFKWCIYLGLAERHSATAAMNHVLDHGDYGLTWAALFRLNCQAIRYAACQVPCTLSCCCQCPEAPDKITCNGILAQTAYKAIEWQTTGIKGN